MFLTLTFYAMERLQEIQELLSTVFGQLQTFTKKQREDWEAALPLTVSALSKQDFNQIRNQSFVIDRMDLFQKNQIDEQKRASVRQAVGSVGNEQSISESRVFLREVPVRSTQIPNSVPEWAAGSRPEVTYGPLPHIDGREIFVDIYRVERMITLYQQGNNQPALLFTGRWRTNRLVLQGNELKDLARDEYSLVEGSVWIRVDLFAQGLPSNRYIGLAVKGGMVRLSIKPTVVNNRLVIPSLSKVNISLELKAQEVSTLGDGPLGEDARATNIILPQKFDFEFTGPGLAKITHLSDASATLYGVDMKFGYLGSGVPFFHQRTNRMMFPMRCNQSELEILSQKSPYCKLSGKAGIEASWWAVPAAILDINAPLQASGEGGLAVLAMEGFSLSCLGQGGNDGKLVSPLFILDPGRIALTDTKSSWHGTFQDIQYYKDSINPHGTSIHLAFKNESPFVYNVLSEGIEMTMTEVNADIQIDRPVQVNGHAFEILTKDSVFVTIATVGKNAVYFYDGNIIWDSSKGEGERRTPSFKTKAIALENGLFSVSPVNACIIFGEVNQEWNKIIESHTFLQFGLFGYMPTLPDPYLINYKWRRDTRVNIQKGVEGIQNWLICQLVQKPQAEGELDDLKISFHHANQLQSLKSATASSQSAPPVATKPVFASSGNTATAFGGRTKKNPDKKLVSPLPDYESQYNGMFGQKLLDYFALLDVSSNANQLGVSVGAGIYSRIDFDRQRHVAGVAVSDAEGNYNIEAVNHSGLIIEGMQVQLPATMARIFTLPQVAWEPLFNLSPPDEVEDEHGNKFTMPGDPPGKFNYYPNDGGPTRIFNNRPFPVQLAPIPLSKFLEEHFSKKDQTRLEFYFTLPFGLKAFSLLGFDNSREEIKPSFLNIRPAFPNNIKGGIHLATIAGNHGKKEAVSNNDVQLPDKPMFAGATVQLSNVLDMVGNQTGTSTLGHSVSYIFNNEFFVDQEEPNQLTGRGVPLTRMDFTGYGASSFSDWESPSAAIAQTSQAKFQIMLGRTAQEVIQVKSLIYPWGIRVVRTITILRGANGFVFRTDSGWQPESNGLFDFGYNYTVNKDLKTEKSPYAIHPGIISGLFDVKNIKEDPTLPEFDDKNEYKVGDEFINIFGEKVILDVPKTQKVYCVPVWFDADFEIENVVQGQKNGRVPSKKILGYIQLAPAGVPLTPGKLVNLLNLQNGEIGGDVDCTIDLNKSSQQMRINRVSFSHAVNNSGQPVFVLSARGSVFLPKDGSWTMVQHDRGTGEVFPLPAHQPVPVIRTGLWVKNSVIDPSVKQDKLIRLANPTEIDRVPNDDTLNFGFLQSTSTQKALFLTPSFMPNSKKLLSKTPPLFVDAYRLMRSNSIFPNIGDASSNFGEAVPLFHVYKHSEPSIKLNAFDEVNFEDGNIKVLELMELDPITAGAGVVVEQGFKLLTGQRNPTHSQPVSFDMPQSQDVVLVNMENVLKIYIDYKATPQGKPENKSRLDFDILSRSPDPSDSWKSRLKDMAMVVDLAGFDRLITIKGNFDSYKGKVPGYEGNVLGSANQGIEVPELELGPELKTVVEILQILAMLGNGEYGDIMKKGLKIAMSNAGEIWEYKFEASKELPTIYFPPGDAYNSAATPLRLEASMALGVYFNAAVKVSGDGNQLLPTAGAFIQFKGGLEVMCATIGAATIYAVGKVDLKLACDTREGPNVRMKFGFGATITVGLPVIGNVSVTYVVGADLYISSKKFQLLAVLLFKGRISLAMGMVSVTIYIEAAGGVSRSGNRTECVASMTFGLEISICFVIDISFEETWQEKRQIA
ncbi:hypothetical protein A33Q_3430 [Indibacter alkaliphilus LW1]|uniref:Uncharacterized protein n=2 Tax=Indibacter TaxID=647744 RepID=S2DE16_INDAL|nr:hypothetical protein A33Q_3430 [Indibacter alkaliphilus LW1]